MIKEVNRACEALNRALGIDVPLPKPKRRQLGAAAAGHLTAGAALIALGAASSLRWCMVLGGLGIVSGVILRLESGER